MFLATSVVRASSSAATVLQGSASRYLDRYALKRTRKCGQFSTLPENVGGLTFRVLVCFADTAVAVCRGLAAGLDEVGGGAACFVAFPNRALVLALAFMIFLYSSSCPVDSQISISSIASVEHPKALV